jgi:hypothetical protein
VQLVQAVAQFVEFELLLCKGGSVLRVCAGAFARR